MKLSELIKEVNKDIDDQLPNADITGWLNRALDDLSPVAKYQKSITISLVKDQKDYVLPTDMNEIVHVIGDVPLHDIPLTDNSSTGYKVWGNSLTIQPTPEESKEITLYYYANLPHLVNPDDVPAIRSDFHDLLVLYTVARAKYMDEEESMQQNAMSEYLNRKLEYVRSITETSNESYQVRLIT